MPLCIAPILDVLGPHVLGFHCKCYTSLSRVEMMCCCARSGYLPLLARMVVHHVLPILENVKRPLFLNPDGVLFFQINISECCH